MAFSRPEICAQVIALRFGLEFDVGFEGDDVSESLLHVPRARRLRIMAALRMVLRLWLVAALRPARFVGAGQRMGQHRGSIVVRGMQPGARLSRGGIGKGR